MSKRLFLAALLSAGMAVSGCGDSRSHANAVYMLVDTSGTYATEAGKAGVIINYLLGTLQAGDSLMVARVTSRSFSEKDIIAKATFDSRPSQANAQKRAFRDQIDAYVKSVRGTAYTDITGGLIQGAQFLNETGAGTKTIIIFSDMQEELDKATIRDFPIKLQDIRVVALNVVKLKTDNIDPRRYMGRLEAWQKRVDILRDKYVEGIKELDRLSREQFGSEFVQLTPEQQDRVLAGMEHPVRNSADALEESQATAGFVPPAPALQQTSHEIHLEFFPLLALHTRQGFYSDSIYGGNKDHVGWQLIGFDGPATLAETHSGRYTTRPYFADAEGTSRKGGDNGAQG